jgi:hypothetical protein
MNKNINNNVMFDLGPHVVVRVLFFNLFILIKYGDYEKIECSPCNIVSL